VARKPDRAESSDDEEDCGECAHATMNRHVRRSA
jgi:hypothetical protein